MVDVSNCSEFQLVGLEGRALQEATEEEEEEEEDHRLYFLFSFSLVLNESVSGLRESRESPPWQIKG